MYKYEVLKDGNMYNNIQYFFVVYQHKKKNPCLRAEKDFQKATVCLDSHFHYVLVKVTDLQGQTVSSIFLL